MTFALTRDGGNFEWAGDTLFTLFCQPRNLFKASMWRMIWDILRFNASARRLLVREKAGGEAMSIEEYLERNGYSDEFRDDYLIVRMMNGSAENTSDGLISSR
jgi:predicted NAD/FAD-binding protein